MLETPKGRVQYNKNSRPATKFYIVNLNFLEDNVLVYCKNQFGRWDSIVREDVLRRRI